MNMVNAMSGKMKSMHVKYMYVMTDWQINRDVATTRYFNILPLSLIGIDKLLENPAFDTYTLKSGL